MSNKAYVQVMILLLVMLTGAYVVVWVPPTTFGLVKARRQYSPIPRCSRVQALSGEWSLECTDEPQNAATGDGAMTKDDGER